MMYYEIVSDKQGQAGDVRDVLAIPFIAKMGNRDFCKK